MNPADHQIVAHAAKTLRARAGAIKPGADGWRWYALGPSPALAYLEYQDPSRPEMNGPLDDEDQAWIATMTPEVGEALADLMEGKGSVAAIARAVLYRPHLVEEEATS